MKRLPLVVGLFLVGCGSGSSTTPDGAMGDGAMGDGAMADAMMADGAVPDATPPDAALPSLRLTGPTTVATWTCVPYVVTLLDGAGTLTNATAVLPVTLGGLGMGRTFASLADCRAGVAQTSFSIAMGTATGMFYFRTSAAEALAMSATADGFLPGNLAVTTTLLQVIGQPDTTTVTQNVSEIERPAGMSLAGGKLLVADELNSRVLIWSAAPTASPTLPALVLGQTTLSGTWGNVGGLTGSTMLNPQDVWTDGTRVVVADTDNHRVLVWNTFPTANGRAADFALGQPAGAANLTSSTINNGGISGASLSGPSGVWSDGTRLFVSDNGNDRVLVWTTFPTAGGQAATFALGAGDLTSPGDTVSSAVATPRPAGIFTLAGKLYVCNAERVSVWNTIPTSSGAPADYALGQPAGAGNLTSADDDTATAAIMNQPNRIASDGTRLFITEVLNHRVLVWNTIPTAGGAPADFALGQPAGAGNLTTELGNGGGLTASSMSSPGAVVTDGTRLYVGDGTNRRVLGWRALPTSGGAPADFVLGQPGATTALGFTATAGNFNDPESILVVGSRLLVADTNHNRILVWNSAPLSPATPADFALGQPAGAANLTSSDAGATAARFDTPGGMLVLGNRLFVADSGNHRVLVWNSIPSAPDVPADFALGQPNVTAHSVNAGGSVGAATMNTPVRIASDGTRLFVTDVFNYRVLVWNTIPTASGAPADFALGQPAGAGNLTTGTSPVGTSGATLSFANGLAVVGGKLFVTDMLAHRVLVWNSIPTVGGTPADFALGQPAGAGNLTSRQSGTNASGLRFPTEVAGSGNQLYVVDGVNNRVLHWSALPSAAGQAATAVIGQPNLTSVAPNRDASPSALGLDRPISIFVDGPRVIIGERGNYRLTLAAAP